MSNNIEEPNPEPEFKPIALTEEEVPTAEAYFNKIFEETITFKVDKEISKEHYMKQKIFDFYYEANSGKEANDESQKEREDKGLDNTFTYGESNYRSLAYILEFIKGNGGIIPGNFYDLGSGAGKAMIAAALNFPFEKIQGCELLDSMLKRAEKVLYKFKENIGKQIEANKDLFKSLDGKVPVFETLKEDIKDFKIEKPSVILICSTMFDPAYMKKLGEKLEPLCSEGTVLITLTERFDDFSSDDWTIYPKFKLQFNWGFPSVYIYRKK